MESIKEERKLLRYTYLLCIVLFVNMFFIGKNGLDKGALIMGVIICILFAYSHFIIRRFFPDGDKYILLFSNVLAVIGMGILYRLDSPTALKQLIWYTVGIAIFILVVVLFPSLTNFGKYKWFYLIATIILMALGSLFGDEVYGAKNWISIGGFSFQPTEFGKLSLVAYLAASLQHYGNDTKQKSDFVKLKALIEPGIVVMISLGLMVLQKDLGSALLFFAISVTMLYIATSKFKYVLVCLVLFMVGGFISYKLFGHVRLRVLIWGDPWKYGYDQGHQVVQSLISIASGGLFGTGMGLGYPTMVPVVTSDFIFAAICEEMGLLTGLAMLILYFLLFYRCMRVPVYSKDNFSRLLAVGYSTMIAAQVLVIVGGVVGAIPLTGITLPLVSYGGSSMIVTFFSLGILQKISEDGQSYE
ncbi:FtsW/RodA/SpoVE family cell cycle protein [Clostridium tagluense]|uniref:FtsW/RodA/SpoVE family cell cycle protein n=1 Tax=Clostridium tagluense TaxID=360422 RepID=UPI001CF1F2D2|nr:FtsW/RodA/SpoVE family cell cycle protein [Clostridium tagluense]MCB2313583.1 FtsW/RodA/SpoVE family cell cycle protein [Clostridium tagluense]MCB2318447.1 FtsW/RodA/SpoVE family cell cycle protein [Clostridium tagluense]MCB2323248.1 FtsW/RodA/SpoVE family cell cycle protein [Clostridium tagluense]MCB2328191.1 FtsW/RodA/SpoVE family cell cycle protein [Clostridium tagluense]MCB2332944.1 FtsW/RodA/SpoVE family cell cycle protein [Clostridium tagluense]